MRMSHDTRFDRFIDKREGGCWIWTGFINVHGYGRFTMYKPEWFQNTSRRHQVMAHRYAYERWVGPIPAGLTIDHLCRVRACVNPDHLEPVGIWENTKRGESLSAVNARKTHCPQGHEYAGTNLKLVKGEHGRVWRQCRTCSLARTNAWRAARRERG